MDRLTGNQSRRDLVLIVGMGGAGKTTLARSVYERRLVAEHFHTRLWVTISQQWTPRQVLTEVLLCQSNRKSRDELNRKSEEDLGVQLYQSLVGRKYLIVMDDIWSVEAWDKLKFFLPDNSNGSRVMITTRLSKLASDLTGSLGVVNVDLLDEDTSWDLLCKKVFAEQGSCCPLELEEIGKTIARKCRGLPLSIVTIGGLLAKSRLANEYWEYVAENLSSLVNSEGDDRCLRILSLSYIHLPVHLKPCFLYMGFFPEDARISASYLVRLWVAEGFLKPIDGKSLEAVGEDYLKDLVERNLVSVVKQERWSSTKEIKYCFVHDLLRDLCVREAHKEMFLSVVRSDHQQGNESNDTRRRIVIHWGTLNPEDSPNHCMPYSSPFLRTCIIDSDNRANCGISLIHVQHHLMRILAGVNRYTYYDVDDIVPLVNSRFLSVRHVPLEDVSLLSSMHWNLQTLMVEYSGYSNASLDIWKMPQLRHAKFKFTEVRLSHPPPSSSSGDRLLVLENLQTLSILINFECSEEVVRRIPNIKKLRLVYSNNNIPGRTSENYYLNNLARLHNLESLAMRLYKAERLDGLALPHSLKKLSLDGLTLDDETMRTVIGGSLPLLQVLKLRQVSFTGDEWNPIEGQFTVLKSLSLDMCYDLKQLNADSTHFACLEHLSIIWTSSLEEFPSGIGDIQTLRSVELTKVSGSVVVSAKRMQEEQEEEFGNDGFEIRVHIGEDQAELKSLASNNFKVLG